jgi:hypothetical protein
MNNIGFCDVTFNASAAGCHDIIRQTALQANQLVNGASDTHAAR